MPQFAGWVALGSDGDTLYTCGAWVDGLHVHTGLHAAARSTAKSSATAASAPAVNASRRLHTAFTQHLTCVAVGSDGHTVLAGCEDGSAFLWRDDGGVLAAHATRLHGHTGAVTCVALQLDLALALTGSEDGTAIMHDAGCGTSIRTFAHPSRAPLHSVHIGGEGEVLLHSSDARTVVLFGLNSAQPLASAALRKAPRRASL
jgi:WD40 repeat protein